MPTSKSALFVSYTSLVGGAERILLDCATTLENTSVACPEGPLADELRRSGTRVVTLRGRRLERRASVRDRLAAPLRTAALVIAYTGLIEVLQFLAPGRHARLEDFLVDALAASLGLVAAAALDWTIRRTQRSLP